jgi:hypothetical protein
VSLLRTWLWKRRMRMRASGNVQRMVSQPEVPPGTATPPKEGSSLSFARKLPQIQLPQVIIAPKA